jgi:hypothetical protein
MYNYLGRNDYFKVRLFFVNTIISPKNSNAITKVLEKKIFLTFTMQSGGEGYINFAEYDLTTDQSIWPNTDYIEEKGHYI